MTLRRYIAAISLLTSVLLGGLIAPLSHFAYMALSDSDVITVSGMDHASMNHGSAALESSGGVELVSSGTAHFECPFAAFFLNQASAVSCDADFAADLSPSGEASSDVATSLTTRLVPALIARGPPAFIQISA